MIRLITSDDIIETYQKINQRGIQYILSKFQTSEANRTKSTFNDAAIESSNYWIIPRVRQRWNIKISGESNTTYEQYFVEKYLQGKSDLKLLSLGSGICSHETIFAKHPCFKEVTCVDFSDKLLLQAKKNAEAQGIYNMVFKAEDVNTMQIEAQYYDVVLFHASLHHFKDVLSLLSKIKTGLKSDGLLVINEYVGPNRIQLKEKQISEINRVLRQIIPEKYKQRFKSNKIKNSVSGPGFLRMIITDPSEAVESESIRPSIQKLFRTLEEKKIGGDLLMLLFKDISHNFLENSQETNALLEQIFAAEDAYLAKNDSDFIFGVYGK